MNLIKHCRQWSIPEKPLDDNIAHSNIRRFNLNLISLCLGAVCTGLTLGWSDTSITYNTIIKCTNVCYDLSSDGSATIHLIVNLGSCLGALVPACLVDISGRRHNFCISAIASIVFWLILAIANDNVTVMLGAAVGGFSAGLFIVTSMMYVGEVSSPDQRGTIGALAAFFAYLGILVSTSFSTFYNYQLVPFFMAFVPIGFLLSLNFWMIESPYFLYESGNTLEAKLALKALRGAHHILDVELEYGLMEKFFSFSDKEIKSSHNTLKLAFFSHSRRISTSITMVLLCASQMVGSYAMDIYSKDFLDNVEPKFTKIIIAMLDLSSIGICVFLIEKVGRRPLLMLSIGGSSICCLVLAVGAIWHQGSEYPNERVITLAVIIMYYVSSSLGVTPILPVLTGEVFSSKMKTICISICFSLFYLTAMMNQAIFEMLNSKKGAYVASLSFTIVGSLGLIFVIVFLPETRAKSLTQIQNELAEYPIFLA